MTMRSHFQHLTQATPCLWHGSQNENSLHLRFMRTLKYLNEGVFYPKAIKHVFNISRCIICGVYGNPGWYIANGYVVYLWKAPKKDNFKTNNYLRRGSVKLICNDSLGWHHRDIFTCSIGECNLPFCVFFRWTHALHSFGRYDTFTILSWLGDKWGWVKKCFEKNISNWNWSPHYEAIDVTMYKIDMVPRLAPLHRNPHSSECNLFVGRQLYRPLSRWNHVLALCQSRLLKGALKRLLAVEGDLRREARKVNATFGQFPDLASQPTTNVVNPRSLECQYSNFGVNKHCLTKVRAIPTLKYNILKKRNEIKGNAMLLSHTANFNFIFEGWPLCDANHPHRGA